MTSYYCQDRACSVTLDDCARCKESICIYLKEGAKMPQFNKKEKTE